MSAQQPLELGAVSSSPMELGTKMDTAGKQQDGSHSVVRCGERVSPSLVHLTSMSKTPTASDSETVTQTSVFCPSFVSFLSSMYCFVLCFLMSTSLFIVR
jgi:hypothetical protein